MAKQVGAGELRTTIRVFAYIDNAPNGSGRFSGEQSQVATMRCKWVNAHGREVYDAQQAGVEEPATLTLRYTPKLTAACTVFRGADPDPYGVISVNDVDDRHVWLEVKVQRKGRGR